MLVTLRAWLLAAHAFPLTAVMALTALIAVTSSAGEPDGTRFAALLVAMLGSQLAIGWSNDFLDREADAVHQPWKPVARGQVDASKMPLAIAVALAVALLAGVALGWPAVAFLVIGTSAGLAYNLGLKASRFSAVPFVVALGVLPPFVWTALDIYQSDFLALYVVATPLAFAAHLANVIPDIEGDRAQGRTTLAVVLGLPVSVAVATTCLVWPLLLTALVPRPSDDAADFYDESRLLPSVLAYIALTSIAFSIYWSCLRSPSRRALVWAFRCVVVGSVVFVAGWLAAVA